MSEYGWEVLAVLAALAVVDLLAGTVLLARLRYWVLLGTVLLATFVFDGYLDARPVVRYGWRYLSGVQLWKVPLEDFGYGIAMATVAVISWEVLGRWGRAKRRDS